MKSTKTNWGGATLNKKAFTLIELLAVIVILAIIALIATPIILNIIEDARKESAERSVELYASAIKNAIAAKQMTGEEITDISQITNMSDYYDGNVTCTTTDIYADGTIYLAGCTVNGTLLEDYAYGKQQSSGETAICEAVTVATSGSYTAGDKYSCKVDPNKEPYTFFVLTTADSSATNVNLIMESNINATGEPVKTTTDGLVAWTSKTDYLAAGGTQTDWDSVCTDCGNNNKGPITAMNYLANATASWTNLGNKQTISSFDDDAWNTHTMNPGIESYARLPYKSEVADYNESNTYLYDYLSTDGGVATNEVAYVYGYWTLSSDASNSDGAWYVSCYAAVGGNGVGNDGSTGVRPVITVSKSKLS